jgi:hypothetical protein
LSARPRRSPVFERLMLTSSRFKTAPTSLTRCAIG